MTGHGGQSFLKFQDWEQVTSDDLAAAFEQMHSQKRYEQTFSIIVVFADIIDCCSLRTAAKVGHCNRPFEVPISLPLDAAKKARTLTRTMTIATSEQQS